MNKHNIILMFEAINSNPNGDPDASNAPRTSSDGFGFVTDVCLKRKIRDYVAIVKKDVSPFGIFISKKNEYNKIIEENDKDSACKNFFDIRSFGGVLTRGGKKGRKVKTEEEVEEKVEEKNTTTDAICGPVQIGYAESFSPVEILEVSNTRTCAQGKEAGENTFGHRSVVRYGLYSCLISVDSNRAGQTGFNDKDLEIMIEALQNIFAYDKSSARPEMNVRGLWVVEHESEIGSQPEWKIKESIKVTSKVEAPKKFSDYTIEDNLSGMKNVKVTKVV